MYAETGVPMRGAQETALRPPAVVDKTPADASRGQRDRCDRRPSDPCMPIKRAKHSTIIITTGVMDRYRSLPVGVGVMVGIQHALELGQNDAKALLLLQSCLQ